MGYNSSISLNKTSYAAGDTVLVTVTLKDPQGNLLTEQGPLLDDSSISLPNVVAKTGITGFTEKAWCLHS